MTFDTYQQKGGAIVAALDVGSSKTACLIVQLAQNQAGGSLLASARLLGVGVQRSRGLKGGLVFDREAVELTIRSAVDKAERQAGFSIDELYISLNAGRLHSQNYGAVLQLAGGKVKAAHQNRLLRQGWDHVANSPLAILHAQPIGYALDGATGIDNPVGFSGHQLFADFHVVSADLEPVKQLLGCIEDSYLSPVSVVAAPYASALATLRQREANEGVAVLDIGGGTSSLAVFASGQFIFANSLAKGGSAVSSALARSFRMSWSDAERLKLHIGAHADHGCSYPQGTQLISRQLMGIFYHQKKKMVDAGFVFDAVKYVVLTGGGSAYFDAPRIAAEVFGKPVRVGAPAGVSGLPQQLISPAFASLWGTIAYQNVRKSELSHRFAKPISQSLAGSLSGGSFSRLGSWLHQLGS